MPTHARTRTIRRRTPAGAVAAWGGVGLMLAAAVPASAAPADAAYFPRVAHVALTDDNEFVPAALTVRRGTLVRWVHVDPRRFDDDTVPVPHNVTSTSEPQVLNSGDFTFQQTYWHWFRKAGTYEYECTRHEGMTGTVTVTS